MYGIRTLSDTASGHFFVNFDIYKWLYLAYYWVYLHQTWGFSKLGDFVKLGLHVLTMWINSC